MAASVLHVTVHMVLPSLLYYILRGACGRLHFTDRETEAQRSKPDL